MTGASSLSLTTGPYGHNSCTFIEGFLGDDAVLEDFGQRAGEEVEEEGEEPVEEGLDHEEDTDEDHVREVVFLGLGSKALPGSSQGLS